jgi:hypothetical protein
MDRLAMARKKAVSFRLIAKRLKLLQLYLQQRSEDKQLAKFIPDIDQKIRHLEGRASLAGLHRLRWILRSWREYQRYARGPIAMLLDAFIVSAEKVSNGEVSSNLSADSGYSNRKNGKGD